MVGTAAMQRMETLTDGGLSEGIPGWESGVEHVLLRRTMSGKAGAMSFLRIAAGLTCTAFLAVLMTPLLLVLLPWRVA